MPTLTAAATVTSTLRLGPLVASPNFRHPLVLAKDLVALDDVSRGRVTCGVGAGGTGWDATMLGHEAWPPGERAARFAEFVEVLDRVLTSPAATTEGRWYPVTEARTHPGCVQRPRLPLVVAATGPRGLAVAARHGQGWVTTGPDVEAQLEGLEAACRDAGRDPAGIDRMLLTGLQVDAGLSSVDEFEDLAGRSAARGITDLIVHWPRPTEPYRADLATFERIFGG